MEKEFFVYILKDPDNNLPFYVGKGKGYRDKSHLRPSLWMNPDSTTNPFLYYKIQSIMKQHKHPIVEKVFINLTEDEAYNIEENLIAEYGLRFAGNKDGILFNICSTKSNSYSGYKNPWNEERKEKHKKNSKKRRKYDPSYEELFEEYVVKNKTRKKISQENECSEVLVKKRLSELNIVKPAGAQYPSRNLIVCANCVKEFWVPNKTRRKVCSRSCYFEYKKRIKHE